MINTRYEEYEHFKENLPFVMHIDLERTSLICSDAKNWHEDLEIQLCAEGKGEVLLNGECYCFKKNDIAVVGSNVIHYTRTYDMLKYTCIIISSAFCKQIGIDYTQLKFNPLIKDDRAVNIIEELKNTYIKQDIPCRIARLNELVIKLLILLTENYSLKNCKPDINSKAFKNIKSTIKFIRQNYSRRITLDEIAKNACTDKFALCRDFKKFTSQTVIEHLNDYRCQKAADYLYEGYSVSEAARMCGFDNLSFFTRTFKRYMGILPSKCKNRL